ncbi:MAG TPA: hypothetical protein VIZ31_01705 [Vicinamibacteria bacterium]
MVVLGLLPSGSGFAADQAERAAIRRAYEGLNAAHKAQDWPTMLARSRELVALAPRSTRALSTLARAQSRNGQAAEAVASLMRLADLGIRFDLARDEDLKPLAGRPDFLAVTDRMQALLAPIGTSAAAFSLPEKDLLTEAVVHDPKTGAFFVSSVHRRKVVKVDAAGAAADFVREGQNGLFAAMGLAVDPARRSLYVSSEAVPLMTGFRKEDEGRSAVFEFDLDTARLRRRVEPPGEGARASDLTVGPDGTLFAADPRAGAVYRLPPQAAALEVLVGPGPLGSAQGLALSVDGAFLFVADYTQGIARVEVSSGRVTFLETPPDLAVTGIDGLVLAGDSLVGIQNGLEPHRVLRLRLDAAQGRIVEGSILERANPHFDEPTLGVRVGQDFYYVANSQYEAFGEDGKVDEARLKAPVVLRMALPWMAKP